MRACMCVYSVMEVLRIRKAKDISAVKHVFLFTIYKHVYIFACVYCMEEMLRIQNELITLVLSSRYVYL